MPHWLDELLCELEFSVGTRITIFWCDRVSHHTLLSGHIGVTVDAQLAVASPLRCRRRHLALGLLLGDTYRGDLKLFKSLSVI